jgi:hypothetical protein
MSSAFKRKRSADTPILADASLNADAATLAEPVTSSCDTEAVDLLQPVQETPSATAAHRAHGPTVPAPAPLPASSDGNQVLLQSSDTYSNALPPVSGGAAMQVEPADLSIEVPSAAGAAVVAPVSDAARRHPGGVGLQGGNRARFMAGLQPSKVSCDLTSAPTSPGMRFSFEAILLVVYPAKTTPPERRYVELMDQHGTTGITIWNAYVHAVKPSCVGCVIKFTRLSLTMHNGKKSLTMSKDSTMHVETSEYQGALPSWWKSLLSEPTLHCARFHDMPSASVVNVSGILGFIGQEEKIVNGEVKMLLILYITDHTGKLEIRSWNHSDVEFLQYRERPVLFQRVRVCLYAGTRTGELLTGPHGTTITTDFNNRHLQEYWAE